jgi:glutaminyl-tRNA synthetase
LYNTLFLNPRPDAEEDWKSQVNPDSLERLTDSFVEPALADAAPGQRFQFERIGYFCVDRDSAPGRLVFNRTVSLRDTWAKVEKAEAQG